METNQKVYLGDGVYAEDDGHGIVLTTSNGIDVTNVIYLEPEVLDKLLSVVFSRGDEIPM